MLRGEVEFSIRCRGCGPHVCFSPVAEHTKLDALCEKCQRKIDSAARRQRKREFLQAERWLINPSQFYKKPCGAPARRSEAMSIVVKERPVHNMADSAEPPLSPVRLPSSKAERAMAAVVALQVQVVPSRPPLKWAGGKRWLVPHIAEIWQDHKHRRLVEPFCGGLAVTLGLRPKRALLNDINPHAVHFYSWLNRGLKVDERLEFANSEPLYYQHRRRFNELISNGGAESAEAAALFYYLNRTCYNGLCRFNSNGQFNVPFGRYKRINYNRDFSDYCRILGEWQFSTGDFEQVAVDVGDFVYADPPYDVEFRSYSKEGFTQAAGNQGGGAPQIPSAPGAIHQNDNRPDSLTKEQIMTILGQSKDLNDAKLKLGLGPSTDKALAGYLASKGFAAPEPTGEPKYKYQGPSAGPLSEPYDRRHRTIVVPADALGVDPLISERVEVYATPEEAEQMKADAERAYHARVLAAAAGGIARIGAGKQGFNAVVDSPENNPGKPTPALVEKGNIKKGDVKGEGEGLRRVPAMPTLTDPGRGNPINPGRLKRIP